ncbi:MAG: HAD-IA family hydrolase [Oscillatoriales cyanobacterium RM2_1_1]|nr:HAD-IA family hydrolase [Oscillatoriales cyanobacterium SM2_3_0]NJO46674.1 HAD-IA family hydrolase [Oscillatoriales cyanobacterium RM2_1_1]
MKKIIIFDFDGTLADTLDILVSITNRLSQEFGYPPAKPEEVVQLQRLSTRQIVEQSGISLIKLPFLIRRVRMELRREIQAVRLFPQIEEVLFDLKNQGHLLYILTSNTRENVIQVLQRDRIFYLFTAIYSGSNLFGKSRVIRRLLKREKLQREQAVYIGDETRDILAAQQAQIKVIAVGWGFNSPDVLARYHPDALANSPRDLVQIINQLH